MKRTNGCAGETGVVRVLALIACALLITTMTTGLVRAGGGSGIPPVGTWKLDLTPQSSTGTIEGSVAAIPRDLGVLALQGVDLDEGGLAALTQALAPDYPYSYHVPPVTSHDLGCAPVLPVSVCESALGLQITDCAARIASDLLGCLVDYSMPPGSVTLEQVLRSPCGGHVGLLLLIDQQCPACLLNAGAESGGNPQQTYNTCMNQQGPRYAYGGSVGQLILSKLPIDDVGVVEFPSYLQRRANIYATIDGERYGFASFPSDVLLDFGLSAFAPPLPSDLQPVLAQQMLDSDANVLLGDFASGTLYQSVAYDALLSGFDDLAPGALTRCTQAMIDALDPRCITSTGTVIRTPVDVDHALVRVGSNGCPGSDPPSLIGETSGLSDHAGLRVCGNDRIFGNGFDAAQASFGNRGKETG